MWEGVLYDFVFTELPFKTISGYVTAFHRIIVLDIKSLISAAQKHNHCCCLNVSPPIFKQKTFKHWANIKTTLFSCMMFTGCMTSDRLFRVPSTQRVNLEQTDDTTGSHLSMLHVILLQLLMLLLDTCI